jgi:nucleoside-diphosphate-sugar epimerase
MGHTVLVTGATGALGPHLLAALRGHSAIDRVVAVVRPTSLTARRTRALQFAIERLSQPGIAHVPFPETRSHGLTLVAGDITKPGLALDRSDTALLAKVDVVIHGASDTRFGAPLWQLREVNVDGTAHALAMAADACPRLQQFLFVSTTCVAGLRTGSIAECAGDASPRFLNHYEQTKWEAEQRVVASGLPARIARLSTCVGGSIDGYVHRLGAFHHAIGWLMRGLVPMVPGVPGASVDLIATDVAAHWLARAVSLPPAGVDVCQVAAGSQAPSLDALLDTAVAHLRTHVPAWKAGQIAPPTIVDRVTFNLFARAVADSGDALFAKVLGAASSFFATLLYPKVFETAASERVWVGPLPVGDWQSTLEKVIEFRRGDAARRKVHEAAYA